MALSKGTNAYATVAEADAYFTDRIDADTWTAASATKKAQALITATQLLDTLNWTGVAVSESQPLAFPRSGEFFDPRLGTNIFIQDSTPNYVVRANYELALHLLNNTGVLDDTGSVDSVNLGTVSLTNILTPSKIPSSVRRIIKPLLVNSGSNPWFRSN